MKAKRQLSCSKLVLRSEALLRRVVYSILGEHRASRIEERIYAYNESVGQTATGKIEGP